MTHIDDLSSNHRPDMDDPDDDLEPCGEGMCNCHCGGGHVCGCDCWRCDDCRQLEENCHCSEEDE